MVSTEPLLQELQCKAISRVFLKEVYTVYIYIHNFIITNI